MIPKLSTLLRESLEENRILNCNRLQQMEDHASYDQVLEKERAALKPLFPNFI